MDLLHKNLKRRVKDKNHDLKSGEYDYAYYEQSNMNNMGFPSKVSIDGDQDHMDIIYDLIRKKKLKRIEQVEPTLSEFHTAKDHISSYASSSILDDDLGLYMVAQREVREHGDESSCSDSDCSEESKTLLGSEWLKDSESYSFITPDYQYDEN